MNTDQTLEFLYQGTQAHFLMNPSEKNVMVNATEMAKIFNKKTELFLKSDHAKKYIEISKLQPNGGRIIENRGRNGMYFNRKLALKFAAWLSPEFEFWVFDTMDKILFAPLEDRKTVLVNITDIHNRRHELRENLKDNPHYKELKQLDEKVRQANQLLKSLDKKMSSNQGKLEL